MNLERAEAHADHSMLLEEITRLRALAESENARGGLARDDILLLRAELTKTSQLWLDEVERGGEKSAAIARVRELCAEPTGFGHTVPVAAVLRALDGAS